MDQAFGRRLILLLITALVTSVRSASSLPDKRGYKAGDYIPLFANRLQPVNDECNRRSYFSLPFCYPGNEITNRKRSLGEILEGDCFANTLYELRFKIGKIGEILCEKNLTKHEVAKFREAVKDNFQFQMSYSTILFWSYVGHVDKTSDSGPKYYLAKHMNFYVYYFRNQVKRIEVMNGLDSAVDITENASIKINFTYSVFWNQSKINYIDLETLLDDYYSRTEEQRKGVWLYLFCFCLIFMWGNLLYVGIGFYLQNYITRTMTSNEDMEEGMGQSGLRHIHGDACKCPPCTSLLGAILGNGTQQLILIFAVFILTYTRILIPCYRVPLSAVLLLSYSLTSVVAGYIGTSFHNGYTAAGWKECVFQTGILFLLPSVLSFIYVNTVSKIIFGFTSLPRFNTTLVAVLFTWKILTVSLLSLGGGIGYICRTNPTPPCATRRIPRAVPHISWYIYTPSQIFLGGLLPFMTIFWEIDDIYASLWSKKFCGAFDTMLTACIRVIIMTIIVGMGFTYIQLKKHDQQWWWISVFRGGSTAVFMFVYGVYFYARAVTDEWPLLLLMGLGACIFYSFFLALGTIGFIASLVVFKCKYKVALKNE